MKEIFGLKPNNVELYKLALIHRSASQYLDVEQGTAKAEGVNPNRRRRRGVSRGGKLTINNERLEFLGDAVIESVVSDYLYIAFPHEDEGFLTQMRSRMVSRNSLNELCAAIGLDKHIRSNAGGGGVQKNINGDAFEAIIGAMYLDKGYEVTNRVLIGLFTGHHSLDEVTTTETDFKSRLIEWCQRNRHRLSFDTSFDKMGSKSAPVFRAAVVIDGQRVAYGQGSSKKEAEQSAALAASRELDSRLNDEMVDMIMEMADRAAEQMPDEDAASSASEGTGVGAQSAGESSEVARKRRHRGGRNRRRHGDGLISAGSGEKVQADKPLENKQQDNKPVTDGTLKGKHASEKSAARKAEDVLGSIVDEAKPATKPADRYTDNKAITHSKPKAAPTPEATAKSDVTAIARSEVAAKSDAEPKLAKRKPGRPKKSETTTTASKAASEPKVADKTEVTEKPKETKHTTTRRSAGKAKIATPAKIEVPTKPAEATDTKPATATKRKPGRPKKSDPAVATKIEVKDESAIKSAKTVKPKAKARVAMHATATTEPPEQVKMKPAREVKPKAEAKTKGEEGAKGETNPKGKPGQSKKNANKTSGKPKAATAPKSQPATTPKVQVKTRAATPKVPTQE